MLKLSRALPNKPSKILREALRELLLIEKQKHFRVNLDVYVEENSDDGVCEVCLAGAVMVNRNSRVREAKTLREFHAFSRSAWNKFNFLDTIRRGLIARAFEHLNIQRPKEMPLLIYVHPYSINPKRWRQDIRKIAYLLEKHGV